MRLSLASRIFLGYAVVLITFGAVSIYGVVLLRDHQQELRVVSQGYLELAQDIAGALTVHENRERDTRRMVEEANPDARRSLARLSRVYFPALMAERLASAKQRAQELATFAPASERGFIALQAQRLNLLAQRYADYERALHASLQSPDDERLRVVQELERSIGRELRLIQAHLQARIRERVDRADARANRGSFAIVALSVLAVGVSLAVMAIAARTLRPVRTLTAGVSRIARGDYTAQIGLRGDDEISVLGREFDAMARALQDREVQLREKQEALLRAEQLAAVGRISAQVAHEVRNPLSSIGLNVELLEEAVSRAQFATEAERTETHELLSSMTREIDRLTDVTEQYLRLARVPKPHLEAENLNGVVANVLDFASEELGRAGVSVSRDLADDLPPALADESQLRQVFLNLLRNSREAMREGGQLIVRSRAVNGSVEVRFEDTGRGMPPEVRERIFEPFFSTKDGGTGLGLAVSRQIIQAHGGSIECQSAPGSGTTFVVRLPRA